MNYQFILQNLYPDGSVQGQCGVFVHKLIQIPLVGDTLSSKTAAVKKYGYTAAQTLGGYSAGDAIVFDVGTKAGHIGFCNKLENGVMTISESNWNNDLKVHHTRQIGVRDKSIVGCLRGKLLFPIPPQTFNQRVLVLCSNIPNQAQLIQGIRQYADKVKAKTGLIIMVDYVNTSVKFTPVKDPSGVIYVDPQAIFNEGTRVEKQLDKEYNVVGLVFDDTGMNPKPNHPVEYPIYQNGFNVFSIPLDWISSLSDPTIPFEIYPQSVEIFFAHELMHAEYFLVNKLSQNVVRDRTHDLMPITSEKPSPIDFFLDYMVELKAWYDLLTL